MNKKKPDIKRPPWRPPKFDTPEALWSAFQDYIDWVKNNPIIEIDYRGKDAERVELPHKRPLTIHGFQSFIGAGMHWFTEFKKLSQTYKNNECFSYVYTRIENECRADKFDGAAVGVYNANIIARDLGLTDRVNVSNEAEIAANVASKFPFKPVQDEPGLQ